MPDWLGWLIAVTGESSERGIARKVGVTHTTVQRWVKEGVPPKRVRQITTEYGADPIEALVLSGWLTDEQIAGLNYDALVQYIPIATLTREAHRRAATYSETRPDLLRKTRTGYGTGPTSSDIAGRPSFRLTTRTA